MKLLTKTGYYYLTLTIFLFLAGGTLFYVYISRLLNEEINEQLFIAKDKIVSYVNTTLSLPASSPVDDYKLILVPVPDQVSESILDTFLLSPLLDEQLPYRRLIFPVSLNGQHYAAILHQPLIEKDDLLQAVLKSLGWMTGIFVVVLVMMSRWISYRLWKPFYQTLYQLQRIGLKDAPHFAKRNIDEFNALHQELNRLIQRIQTQYKNLKEFTENASHELQTPISIIRNNLESLLQSEALPQADRIIVRRTYESTHRLSRILQSLLLLSKIENLQFVNVIPLPIMPLLDSGMQLFKEIQEYKNINVEFLVKHDGIIHMDPYLADVLISNLLGNAFKHCPMEGSVTVEWDNQILTISNSGPLLDIPEENLFDRFMKGNRTIESTGLGLAIVKQICDLYGLSLSYAYMKALHTFKVKF